MSSWSTLTTRLRWANTAKAVPLSESFVDFADLIKDEDSISDKKFDV